MLYVWRHLHYLKINYNQTCPWTSSVCFYLRKCKPQFTVWQHQNTEGKISALFIAGPLNIFLWLLPRAFIKKWCSHSHSFSLLRQKKIVYCLLSLKEEKLNMPIKSCHNRAAVEVKPISLIPNPPTNMGRIDCWNLSSLKYLCYKSQELGG